METLTKREREVVALVAHGLSNDEIADAMVLSPATAKTHVSRAMIKLGARDRAQLVVFAYQTGLVSPRDPDARILDSNGRVDCRRREPGGPSHPGREDLGSPR
jgi:DNA-binding CsgD family transcriptional regulator